MRSVRERALISSSGAIPRYLPAVIAETVRVMICVSITSPTTGAVIRVDSSVSGAVPVVSTRTVTAVRGKAERAGSASMTRRVCPLRRPGISHAWPRRSGGRLRRRQAASRPSPPEHPPAHANRSAAARRRPVARTPGAAGGESIFQPCCIPRWRGISPGRGSDDERAAWCDRPQLCHLECLFLTVRHRGGGWVRWKCRRGDVTCGTSSVMLSCRWRRTRWSWWRGCCYSTTHRSYDDCRGATGRSRWGSVWPRRPRWSRPWCGWC